MSTKPDTIQTILEMYCPVRDKRKLRDAWDAVWSRFLWEQLNLDWDSIKNSSNNQFFVMDRLNERFHPFESLHVRPELHREAVSDHDRKLSAATWRLFHNQRRRDTSSDDDETALFCCVEYIDGTFECYETVNRDHHAEMNALDFLDSIPSSEIYRIVMYICWSPCKDCCSEIMKFRNKLRISQFSVKFPSIYMHRNGETMEALRKLSRVVDVSVFDKKDWINLEKHLNDYDYNLLRNEESNADSLVSSSSASSSSSSSSSEEEEEDTSSSLSNVSESEGEEEVEKQNEVSTSEESDCGAADRPIYDDSGDDHDEVVFPRRKKIKLCVF